MSHKLITVGKVHRTCNWTEIETNLLLDVWCEKQIQEELLRYSRNQHVFDRIAEYLEKNGYNRTSNQCREKIKTLKKEYIYAQHSIKTGTKLKSDFPYWDRLESVMKDTYYNTRNFSNFEAPRTRSKTENAMKQEMIELVSDVDVVDHCGNTMPFAEGAAPPQNLNGEEFSSIDLNYGPIIDESYHMPDYYESNQSTQFDTTRLEKTIEEAAAKVATVLADNQARLLQFEENRLKFEAEQEEKRQKENREHEIQLVNTVGQIFLQAIQMLNQNHNNCRNGGCCSDPIPNSTNKSSSSSSSSSTLK